MKNSKQIRSGFCISYEKRTSVQIFSFEYFSFDNFSLKYFHSHYSHPIISIQTFSVKLFSLRLSSFKPPVETWKSQMSTNLWWKCNQMISLENVMRWVFHSNLIKEAVTLQNIYSNCIRCCLWVISIMS